MDNSHGKHMLRLWPIVVTETVGALATVRSDDSTEAPGSTLFRDAYPAPMLTGDDHILSVAEGAGGWNLSRASTDKMIECSENEWVR